MSPLRTLSPHSTGVNREIPTSGRKADHAEKDSPVMGEEGIYFGLRVSGKDLKVPLKDTLIWGLMALLRCGVWSRGQGPQVSLT